MQPTAYGLESQLVAEKNLDQILSKTEKKSTKKRKITVTDNADVNFWENTMSTDPGFEQS